MTIQIKPLFDNVLIEPLLKEKTTPSGIVIPDTAKEKPQEGVVIAIGPGLLNDSGKRISVDVKVGDKVLYKKWGGNEVKYNEKDYLIVSAADILATL